MKLNIEQIRMIACGCADILDEDGKFSFFRFTAEQTAAYRQFRSFEFSRKSLATAGVRLAFRTDSRNLSFDYRFGYGSSRPFGWFDVYEDGIITGHFGGEGKLFITGRAEVALSEGEKTVELYFPWSKAVSISEVELDDGATLYPVKRPRTMLCFGDSITQGYDAVFPSLTYASQLARMLNAELLNKAVGGDTFFPELLFTKETVDPEIITVAYGTNDWFIHNRERFTVSACAFFDKLTQKYPRAAVFAIAPIWRADGDRETPFGVPHREMAGVLTEICAMFPQIRVIDGLPLSPHCPDFYADRYLHPNDAGFCLYTRGLYAEIEKYLPEKRPAGQL